jgi:hypothetical protein
MCTFDVKSYISTLVIFVIGMLGEIIIIVKKHVSPHTIIINIC